LKVLALQLQNIYQSYPGNLKAGLGIDARAQTTHKVRMRWLGVRRPDITLILA
jgi:hypothetical protein